MRIARQFGISQADVRKALVTEDRKSGSLTGAGAAVGVATEAPGASVMVATTSSGA